MHNVLILEDDPADAIILREALLEVDPSLSIDSVQHADAALWRIVPPHMHRPEVNHQAPDVVVVGVRRTGSDGCKFVRHVLSQPGLGAPPLVVLASSPCQERVRSRCVAKAYCCVAKPQEYEQYKALVREALNTLRNQPACGKDSAPPKSVCI